MSNLHVQPEGLFGSFYSAGTLQIVKGQHVPALVVYYITTDTQPWSHKPVSLNGRLGNSEIGGCKEIR